MSAQNTTALGTIHFQRDIPVVQQVDVLVVGGGPAGIGAAVAAARLMPICFATGQAAGAAGAIAALDEVAPPM
jgi:alkyl hydroperoxide reductase subunit AhpF